LQKGLNDKIGNKPWSVKEPVIATSKLKLNSTVGALADRTKPEIDKRQLSLATTAPKVWPL
jgi:hypothetical protein